MKYVTLGSVIAELRSRKPETLIADGLIKGAYDLVFPLFLAGIGFLSHFARKYVPSIRPYLTPSLPWVVVAACIVAAILIFNTFSNWGRRSRLLHLLRLVRRYDRFSHEKEMEVVSRVHSRTSAAALVFLVTFVLMLPLAAAISVLFGVAIISDITNNIKGTSIHPSFGPKLFFNAYGIGLGAFLSWIINLLESARLESLLLSPKYRRKMILTWRASIVKLKAKLRKKPCRQASTQSTSAHA